MTAEILIVKRRELANVAVVTVKRMPPAIAGRAFCADRHRMNHAIEAGKIPVTPGLRAERRAGDGR